MKVSIFASVLSARFRAAASIRAGFLGGAVFVFAVVRQDAVFQFRFQNRRETGYCAGFLAYHFRSHDDVAQKLAVVGVVVFREEGDFSCFSDVMADGCRDQEVLFSSG